MKNEHYEELLNIKVKDKMLNKVLNDYITLKYNESFKQYINILINSFQDIEIKDLSWALLCNQIFVLNRGIKVLIIFYGYMLKEGIDLGEHTIFLKENIWILLGDDEKDYKISNYKEIYSLGSSPLGIIMVKTNKNKFVLNLNFYDIFLLNIARTFIKYLETENITYEGDRIEEFICDFENSLEKLGKLPNVIEEFGNDTFLIQFQYYQLKVKKTFALRNLKSFYIFLMDYFENSNPQHKVFSKKSGIDRNFLYRDNFNILFGKGYRVVYLNKYDEIPQNDKWLLAPNGYERYTTTLKGNEYIPLDFSRVGDSFLRNKMKKWFVKSRNCLKTLRASINNLFIFFEFIEGETTKQISGKVVNLNEYAPNNKSNLLISEHNILIFREYLKQKYDNVNTINGYVSSISSFIKFLDDEVDYFINPIIYDYLRIKSTESLNSKIILQEDLDKILETFKNRMLNGSYFDKMFFIFLHLLLTTNYRPNEILNLKINCIKDGMKEGEYKIDYHCKEDSATLEMQTKTSQGRDVDVNPSEYTIRAINEGTRVSRELLQEEQQEQEQEQEQGQEQEQEQEEEVVKNYIFIYKSRNKQIEGIKVDKFYRHFVDITGKLDLKGGPYSLYDCRTTYMTKLFENAVKEGNVYKAIIATGHKDVFTTIKHYIKPDVRSYLEAFYNIKLGNVTLQGRIVSELSEVDLDFSHDIKEITVKQGCGFCGGTCNGNKKIDCLICRNFIVTLDRIPYFEESIDKINEVIKNENIFHEKEHLVSIKKLYVSYLGQLYILKNKLI
ncbi:tyrosine-type recombinase/integrase [Clostridium bowmanii]|uniref:tyrosine-type recombinase/integrase n=1 Tax=Clostridium bowmanii TaxID=132925 RepID=UPI001C0B8640|nr:tyrosine-type recombinase/integrase [Clostridium bowmanii]MBU3190760.1 tyrosine-type recombinase/integrase [Clostridium bowmanii]